MENRQILRLIYMRQHLQRPEGEHYVNWLEELAILCFGEALFRILEIPEETPKIDADMYLRETGRNTTKDGTPLEMMRKQVNNELTHDEKIRNYKSSLSSLQARLRKGKNILSKKAKAGLHVKINRITAKIVREKIALNKEKC